MATTLPELDPVQGAAPSTAAVAPTSFGLVQAGADLAHAASVGFRAEAAMRRAQSVEDQRTVAPDLEGLQGQLNQQLDLDVAAGKQGDPGWVTRQSNAANQAVKDYRAGLAERGLTSGQLAEFDKGASQLVVAHAAQASQKQTEYLAAPIALATATLKASQLNGYTSPAEDETAAAIKNAQLNHAAGDPSLMTDGLASFDQIVAQHRPDDPQLQSAYDARMLVVRTQAAAELRGFQIDNIQTVIQKNFLDQGAASINAITSNPARYGSFVAPGGTLDSLVSTLPVGLQAAGRQQLLEQAVQARVKGLIENQQPDRALTELDRGDYDSILVDPKAKEALRTEAEAGSRAYGAQGIARGEAAATIDERLKANEAAIATHGVSILKPGELDGYARIIGGERVGEEQARIAQLQRGFAAVGPVAGMSNTELAKVQATPAPDPHDPLYPDKIFTWQAQQKAAAREAKARAEPGAWAWTNSGQTMDGTTLGAAMQKRWAAATTPGAGQPVAMGDYVGAMLGVESRAGIAKSAWQVVPQATASQLAADVVRAPPEGRLAAMQHLAQLVDAMPMQFTMADGTVVHPRAIFAQQLGGKGGLTPIEASTIADFSGNPGAMGRVVAALNDSTLTGKKSPGGLVERVRGDPLPGLVKAQVAPFLNSDPQGGPLAQARLDRTLLVARSLEAQGANPADAARTAAADLTGAYAFSAHGWRMPAALAQQPALATGQLQLVGGFPTVAPGQVSGQKAAEIGSQAIVRQLTANDGAQLFAPSSLAGGPADRRRIFAGQVLQNARWQTLPDDSGLALVVPKPDGTMLSVADRYGRPIRATWSDLEGVAAGRASPFAAAPPAALRTDAGAPVPATTKAEGFAALSDAVQWQETRADPARISPKGAIGAMQLMPDTGAHYAAQIGLAWDPQRALTDVAYNRKIGQAALGDLVSRYGAGPGIGLALAAYNAGEGRLTGYRDPKTGGWHPGWLTTIGDPRSGRVSLTDFVKRIPIPETRDYVSQVLQRAVGEIARQH